MKRCARCGKVKEDEESNWRYLGLSRQSICRDCQKLQRREHYESHREQEKARTYEITKDRRERARRFIWDYLSHSVCTDCGEYDPAVLTFDHIRGEKKKDVSKMVAEGYSIEAIQQEISKCEIVCANCHMRREQRRRGRMKWE